MNLNCVDPASQCLGTDPMAAVDGNILGQGEYGGFYSQKNEEDANWMVDFGAEIDVAGVSVVFAMGVAENTPTTGVCIHQGRQDLLKF